MKTKKDIVKDWITRYSGREIKSFGKFILLTNFQKYVDEFARINNVNIDGLDKNMPSATHKEITIISELTADEFLDFVRADFSISKIIRLATHHPKLAVRQLFNIVRGG